MEAPKSAPGPFCAAATKGCRCPVACVLPCPCAFVCALLNEQLRRSAAANSAARATCSGAEAGEEDGSSHSALKLEVHSSALAITDADAMRGKGTGPPAASCVAQAGCCCWGCRFCAACCCCNDCANSTDTRACVAGTGNMLPCRRVPSVALALCDFCFCFCFAACAGLACGANGWPQVHQRRWLGC
jgi:hypothetical protein